MKPAKHTFSQPLETLTNRPVAFVIRSDHGHRREALRLRSLASQCFCTSFFAPVVPMLPMRIRQKHELCFDNARGPGDIPFIEQIVKSPGAGRMSMASRWEVPMRVVWPARSRNGIPKCHG